jgi:hypothetical protein
VVEFAWCGRLAGMGFIVFLGLFALYGLVAFILDNPYRKASGEYEFND